MDRKTAMQRRTLLGDLMDVRATLSSMLYSWESGDMPHDILAKDEYPFHRSLEDLEAEVRHCIELIEERTPRFPPTLTKRELLDALENLDCPDDTPIIGYSDLTDYVNIDGISEGDGGPALVIETRQDYDSRQW